jgi:protein-L-isoaspartate(D-aspartate) O-methyltransferase
MRTNDQLIDDVESRAVSYLGGRPRSARVLDAMRRVDRATFLSGAERRWAYEDAPLPIGHGQTCSEPSMVAFMLEILETAPGQRILEIGAGSGYAAAAASVLCAPEGVVYACETVEALADSMEAHFSLWRAAARQSGDAGPFARIEIIAGDGSAGFPRLAPFDRILISAGVRPERTGCRFSESVLLTQLASDGILVFPEALGELHRSRKTGSGVARDSWMGVSFVPLVGRNA